MFGFIESAEWFRSISENYTIAWYAPIGFGVLVLLEVFRSAHLSDRVRLAILTAASAALIAWIDTISLIIMTGLGLVALILSWSGLDFRKYVLTITGAAVCSLIIAKWLLAAWSPSPLVIVGLSYYVFRLISVVIEIGRKNKDYLQLDPLHFFSYVYFFPIFFAGPIQKYADFYRIELAKSELPRAYAWLGAVILFKIAFVDYLLLQAIISPMRTDLLPVAAEWPVQRRVAFFITHGIVSFIYHYLDFMIYTEIAKSLGKLLGFHVMDNFNRPLLATNIADFWRRWHISMMNWSRDYVFMPLLIRTRRFWVGALASMVMIGLWHSVNANWLVWGLLHAGALITYEMLRRSRPYFFLSEFRAGEWALSILGWLTVIVFLGCVNNLITFAPNYDVAWGFIVSTVSGTR